MIEGDPSQSRPLISSEGGVRETEASAVTVGISAVPKAHENENTQEPIKLQVHILKEDADIESFVQTLSGARFNKYLKKSNGDKRKAIALYHANAKISQCMYIPLQIWEIALRNRLNYFLSWKYNHNWPTDSRLVRNLSSPEKKRLSEAIERQKAERGGKLPTDAVVADLSAGFWVGLLTKSYEATFSWKHNSTRIFPALLMQREEAYEICEKLLTLRNRICHHEAIYHLPLQEQYDGLTKIVAALCAQHSAYHSFSSTFAHTWAEVEACLGENST